MTSPIIERIHQSIQKTPDKHALIFLDKVLTYKELGDAVNTLSYSLQQKGITRGDHIGVVLPNGIEFCLVMLAAANIGAAIVPHNTSLSAKSLHHAFKHADVHHYIIWHSLIHDLQVETTQHEINSLWISVGKDIEQTISFDVLLKCSHLDQIDNTPSYKDDDFILTMTSGSTGAPKPIVLSQACKVKRADAAIQLYSITSEDVILAATPLYHSLAERLVLAPLISGGTAVIMPGFSAQQWLALIEQHKISMTIAVSSQLKKIHDALSSSNYQLSSLRCLVSSSERLPQSLKLNLLAALNCDFHECYGASEVAIISNLDYSTTHSHRDSVGKTIPGTNVCIIDDTGKLLPPGKIGEIACKTPMLFSGYFKREEQTQSAFIEDYFLTGDLGKLDEEGFLYFCGRKKEMIITGGINVYPKDIEELLLHHPDIQEVAVIPLPDDSLGEIVTAVIVSSGAIKQRELQRLCAKELADFQQPREYIFLDKLPKNALGKVMKPTLITKLSDSSEIVS